MIENTQKPLTTKEAAEFLGLSPNYIHQLVHGKKLTAYKPGGKLLYFKQADLEAYAFQKRTLADFEANAAADRILKR
ncbi:MAG: helix-turn-helix domain-containing protein [Treponema sp.]|jgi:excisionase family DNA binding protein|nr:helix-turn-helix domain-containing protein [Treponema sp.]